MQLPLPVSCTTACQRAEKYWESEVLGLVLAVEGRSGHVVTDSADNHRFGTSILKGSVDTKSDFVFLPHL